MNWYGAVIRIICLSSAVYNLTQQARHQLHVQQQQMHMQLAILAHQW